EPQLSLLAMRRRGPILGEGEAHTLDAMLEATPDLATYYVPLQLEEPTLAQTRRILAAWTEHRAEHGSRYTEASVAQALEPCHRFLARSRMPRKAIDFLDHVASTVDRNQEVTEADVIERFHKAFHVPRFLIDPTVPFDPEATEKAFRARVLGQPEAVRAV